MIHLKYDGYVIYSDLDRTIRNSKGIISDKTRDTLAYFQENGGRFALATGRSPEHAGKLGLKFNAPLIVVNGTYVADCGSGKPLAKFSMDSGCKAVYDYAISNFEGLKDYIVFHEGSEYRKTLYDGNMDDAFLQPVFKIVYVFEQESYALAFQSAMTERFSADYSFERSWEVGVEMLSVKGGKGNGVEFVRKFCADSIHTIICAGDFENDISMLRAADIGVAVGNALDSVKAAADVVAPDCDHDPIAWIIENIENLKPQS